MYFMFFCVVYPLKLFKSTMNINYWTIKYNVRISLLNNYQR